MEKKKKNVHERKESDGEGSPVMGTLFWGSLTEGKPQSKDKNEKKKKKSDF